MHYVSTRGAAPRLDFEGVLLAGPAADGGLYVPESWPALAGGDLKRLAGAPYGALASHVMGPFVGASIAAEAFDRLVTDAYADFAHLSVAPLRQIGPDRWLMELFHGPTLAFKDIALQLLGRLFDRVLRQRGERATVLGATSGDTGAAAIEACRRHPALAIIVLHPAGRISEVQRRQMTTVTDRGIHNLAIAGTFDDCQALVKALFADRDLRESANLTAINSINWARIMAQTVYYVAASLALGGPARAVTFVVPTGNFGDVYAGYVASRMGVPIRRLVVATNRNDILARFFATGEYRLAAVEPTVSPSMDIQVASNFERLLFDLCQRDGRKVAALMADLAERRAFSVGRQELGRAQAPFAAARVEETETLAAIARCHRASGILVDPHTAVGLAAADRLATAEDGPVVVLATAHPAKFPDAVERATGVRPALPPAYADLFERPERYDTLPADLAAVRTYVSRHAVAQYSPRIELPS